MPITIFEERKAFIYDGSSGQNMEKIKLIVIVGPTASGKTRLAVELAQKLNGEVVSADSMQIYQEMNIATAKPTIEEMAGIPHHLIDFLPLNTPFNVFDYTVLSKKVIQEIAKRGKLPILTGGTGLYINSVIDNLTFTEEEQNPKLREALYREAEADGGAKLYQYLSEIDPESAAQIHPNNLIRVVRAVEIYRTTGITMSEQKRRSREQPSPYELCMLGLNYRDRQKLYDRINLRVDCMLKAGLLEEAQSILSQDDLKTSYHAIGYKELKGYFDKIEDLKSCIDKIKQESRRYAKRQLTWFRRDQRINWFYIDEFGSFEEVIKKSQKHIETFINLC